MNKNPFDPSLPTTFQPAPRPTWWNDQLTSDWDRVKAALQRDWEQTKADFSIGRAVDLHQNAFDTLKQAAGDGPVPPPQSLTRPDSPHDIAAQQQKSLKVRDKAASEMAEARADMAVERVRADERVATERREADSKYTKANIRAEEKAAAAGREAGETYAKSQAAAADTRRKADGDIADMLTRADETMARQQSKVDVARGDWDHAEAAVRYGFGAQRQYHQQRVWNTEFENRLRSEWIAMNNDATWEEARPFVLRGWEFAGRNPDA